jgi:hypothetical protein
VAWLPALLRSVEVLLQGSESDLMKKISFLFCICILSISVHAQKITGLVTDLAGNVLPYSSITIKNKPGGTTANAEGKFVLKLPPASYTITCQHVGYQLQEKEIILGSEDLSLHFQLSPLRLTLAEVVVKKGEDPAYEIIRQAIKKRAQHKKELPKFSAEVYTKGMLKLRDFPKKFMGQEIDFEDGDTGKKKMIYLSETVSRYYVDGPGKKKVEVLASKVSGESEGFGLSAPEVISFYDNNISIGSNLNPRGFISPIADNALNFYTYKYMGGFFENGRQVSRIKVTPKRKFEPLFTGYINIIDDEWRIHSLELNLLKQYGLQTLDTVRLEQLYAPLSNGAWVVSSQVIYPAIRMFNFDAYGSFLNLYSNYDLNPVFPKGFFDKTILKYTDSANKKSTAFWDETRPVSLQKEEVEDYRKKDSLALVRKSPAYMDSLDRRRNKISFSKLFYTGVSIGKEKKRSVVSFPSLVQAFSYNTVEGVVADIGISYRKRLDSSILSGRSVAINPQLRYGFSNKHVNYNIETNYSYGTTHRNRISVAGGTDVFQFNNQNPVNTLVNTVTTLFAKLNPLKIYEAAFFKAAYSREIEGGLYWTTSVEYQDRKPLENTADFSFDKEKEKLFSPNYPEPATNENIRPHQAFTISVSTRWQPGSKYIELPGRRYSVGSKYPVFSAGLVQSLPGVFGSDLSFSKWRFGISDRMDFQLFGSFNYLVSVGGFLNHDSITVPDYTHFKGNPTVLAESYSGRFQLVPHYYFSNKNSFYGVAFAEHHFNGLITNKIPLLKQLKWNLVTGANGLLLNSGRHYIEPYVGLENIFRILRVDYVMGFEKNRKTLAGFRVGLQTSFNNR